MFRTFNVGDIGQGIVQHRNVRVLNLVAVTHTAVKVTNVISAKAKAHLLLIS
jgi:hypothetical protein